MISKCAFTLRSHFSPALARDYVTRLCAFSWTAFNDDQSAGLCRSCCIIIIWSYLLSVGRARVFPRVRAPGTSGTFTGGWVVVVGGSNGGVGVAAAVVVCQFIYTRERRRRGSGKSGLRSHPGSTTFFYAPSARCRTFGATPVCKLQYNAAAGDAASCLTPSRSRLRTYYITYSLHYQQHSRVCTGCMANSRTYNIMQSRSCRFLFFSSCF